MGVRRKRHIGLKLALGAALTATANGCVAPPEGTWVTRLGGMDAWLGLSVEGSDGAAFVCGGPTMIETHTRWMLTTVTSDKVVFERDGWTLDATLTSGNASGQLTDPDGNATAYDARRVGNDGPAGVYFGFDAGCGDGLIVLDEPNNTALGAWCDSSGLRAQVTPVLPFELTAVGVPAFVDVTAGRRDFVMAPVEPAAVTP